MLKKCFIFVSDLDTFRVETALLILSKLDDGSVFVKKSRQLIWNKNYYENSVTMN